MSAGVTSAPCIAYLYLTITGPNMTDGLNDGEPYNFT